MPFRAVENRGGESCARCALFDRAGEIYPALHPKLLQHACIIVERMARQEEAHRVEFAFEPFRRRPGLRLRQHEAFACARTAEQGALPGQRFFRTVFYVPSLISGVAMAIVFAWIFNSRFGILNYLLSFLKLDGPNWLSDPDFTLSAFVLMSLWGVGSTVVIFIAALQGVPVALYEAASLDGAVGWRRFIHITLPMISPVVLFAAITGVIGTFQTFAVSYIMTSGGPANASLFYLLYLYKNAFNWFEMGYASALAWFLFLIILICTGLLLRTSDLWVHYEGLGKK